MISKKIVRRFSLLMLTEGEYYFQDYGGYFFLSDNILSRSRVDNSAANTSGPKSDEDLGPISDRKRLKGRFHVASSSVIFEPDEIRYPVYKIPLDVKSNPRSYWPSGSRSKYLIVNASKFVEIKENNNDHPYRFQRGTFTFVFSLTYAKLSAVVTQIKQLSDLMVKQRPERDHHLNQLIQKRESSISFEISWLVDYSERPQHDNGQAVLVSVITPLIESPGRVMVTDKRLYIQHFNNVSTEPLDKYELCMIASLVKRRYAMRDKALEVVFRSSKRQDSAEAVSLANFSFLSNNSLYLNFKDKITRDTVYRLILEQKEVNIAGNDMEELVLRMQKLWHEKKISNYEYLLYVNHAAGRSFNDITQYPVFPWIIQDYESRSLKLNDPKTFRDLSKPIGALNEKRLATFRKRMQDMPPEMMVHGKPFLYGTHYSTPGYVLYYLVRKVPEYMLRLQSGHFDVADRLFHSMEFAFQSVLTSNSDVKELIPEFYNIETKGDFTLNTKNLDLGVRQDGTEVDDLVLPNWARSGRDFVKKMRKALESDYVSDNIHNWIDLIFGYKQTGSAAEKAHNLFYPLTYEGAVDIEKIRNPQERASIEAQIREFGQTPRQIFSLPHPKRGDVAKMPKQLFIEKKSSSIDSRTRKGVAAEVGGNKDTANIVKPLKKKEIAKTDTNGSATSSKRSSIVNNLRYGFGLFTSSSSSVTTDPKTRAQSALSQGKKIEVSEKAIKPPPKEENAPKQSPLGLEETKRETKTRIVPTISRGRSNSPVHRRGDRGVLDGKNEDWKTQPAFLHADQSKNPYCSRWGTFSKITPKRRILAHKGAISDVCVDVSGKIVCSVAMDATLKVHNLEDGKQRRSYKVSRRGLSLALSSCEMSPDANTVVMGSWDNSVYVYSVKQGTVVEQTTMHSDAVSSVSLVGENVLSGSWDGTLKLWQLRQNKLSTQPLADFHDHEHPIMCVCCDPTARVACSASSDGVIMVWDLRTGKRQRTIKGHIHPISSIDLSNTGYFVTSVSKDGLIRTFDLTKGDCYNEIKTNDMLSCVKTDGDVIFTSGEKGIVNLWDYQNSFRPKLKTDKLTDSKISSFSLSRDGKWLAVGLACDDGQEDLIICDTSG